MTEAVERLQEALIDRYTIEGEIGRGGMATVFLAEERHPSRKVAIKLMTPDIATRVMRERFLREVNLTSKLTHPHIVPVFAAGEVDDLLYFVMPYIEGESLRHRLKRTGVVPLDEALSLTRELAGALHYAHGFGVVHRDVKPENILLTGGHALVADFGIARALGMAGGDDLTQAGLALGTPAYMSPEQADGLPNVDARTDVYGLGCVLYEMLGGRRHSAASGRTVHEEMNTVEASASTLAILESVLTRALAVDPADRFLSADSFSKALGDLQRPGPPLSPARRAMSLGAVVGAVAIVLAFVISLILPEPSGAAAPPRVVVALYENQTGDSNLDHLGPMATDWITQGLARTGLLDVVVARAGLAVAEPAAVDEDRLRKLADETDAEMVVSGAYYRQGGEVQFQTRITDSEDGRLLLGLSPVIAAVDSPLVAVELLRQRVMGALASLTDERLRAAARAISEPPSYDAYQLYVEGMTEFVRVNQRVAIDRLLRAAELDSTFVTAKLLAAFAYGTLEEWPQADSLAQIVDRSRDALTPLERHQLDWVLRVAAGDIAGSLTAIRAAAEISGPETLIFLAVSAVWANRPREAIAALERLDPERGFARDFFLYGVFLCDALHQAGLHEEELEQARRVRRRYPALRPSVRSELRALYALGRTETVDSLWDLFESMPPLPGLGESPMEVYHLGTLEARAHGWDSLSDATAARAFSWYGALPPREADREANRYGLARLRYAVGDYGEAAALFERLLTEHPDSLGYQGYLGSVAARTGDRDEALRISESLAVFARPYDLGAVTFWRARIASVLGDFDDAMELLRAAAQEGYRHTGEMRFIADLQPMRDYQPFLAWVRPRG